MDIGPGGGGGPVGAASGIGEYALVDGGFVAAVNPLASLPAGKPAHPECRPGGRRSRAHGLVGVADEAEAEAGVDTTKADAIYSCG